MRQKSLSLFLCVFVLTLAYRIQNVNSSKFMQKLNKSLRKVSFLYYCTITQKNQKQFDGTCDLNEDIFHPKIKRIIDDIYKYDGEQTIDHLIRNQLLKDYTQFFEDKYQLNTSYIDTVNSLKDKYDDIGKKLSVSTSNVLVSDFYTAFSSSGMESVANEIVEAKDKILEESDFEDFDNFSKILNCPFGSGFCRKSRDIFKLEDLSDWSPLRVDQALQLMLNNTLNFFRYTKPAIILDYTAVDIFLTSLKNQGTGKVKVSELKIILNKTLIQTTLDYYDKNSEKVTGGKKTTTTPTTVTTTVKMKNNGRVAVDDSVLYGLPLALVMAGVLFVVFFVVFKSLVNKKPRKKLQINEF